MGQLRKSQLRKRPWVKLLILNIAKDLCMMEASANRIAQRRTIADGLKPLTNPLTLKMITHALNSTKFAMIILMPESQVNCVTRVGTTWCTGTLGGNIAKMIKVQVLGVVADMVTSKAVTMIIVLINMLTVSARTRRTAID